jgi:hypothetical protein
MGFTIISISVSLVAVFIPIFFMPGVIGLLFHEFAVIVGLAILVSAVVSLTLVPMLASRLLPRARPRPDEEKSFIGRHFEAGFTKVRNGYAKTLDWRCVPLRGADDRLRHLRADRGAVHDHPERLLPGRRHRPAAREHRSRRRHLVVAP